MSDAPISSTAPALEARPPSSLVELEAQLARDMSLIVIPPTKVWLEPHEHPIAGPMLDVAIIGAGMSGLASAFALKRLGVRNMRLFDQAPAGFEGPWATYARMETLRSPPELTGPALGMANLTFRAWFEAQFGAAAWAAVHRIPRLQWMDYLRWYRKVIDVPVENGVTLLSLSGDAHGVLLTLQSASGTRRVAARRVVLATGRDGLGGPAIPDFVRDLDKDYWAHSSEDIDFKALAGKTVAVVGAGASGVDNAAESLEAGAARVAMLVRRPDVPRVNRGMGIGSPGMFQGFIRMTPAQRWSVVQHIADHGIPAPRDSMLRCTRHRNFSIFTKCAPSRASARNNRVLLETNRGVLAFDYLILATGFRVDWPQRPELAELAPRVVRWRDRFTPPGRETFAQADDPFLGRDFEFLARSGDAQDWVERVHCLAFPAFTSHGGITGDIPGASVGADRVARGIVARLFADDYERNWVRLLAWNTPELRGDEFTVTENIAPFLADAPPETKS